ncbi:hypothetical protein HN011_010444 [Eciton burchellii]|nr:hypothetical protein HN011_010444 [Eciton burchellii]
MQTMLHSHRDLRGSSFSFDKNLRFTIVSSSRDESDIRAPCYVSLKDVRNTCQPKLATCLQVAVCARAQAIKTIDESINSLTTESFSVFAYYTLAQTRTRRDTMNVITMQDLAPTSRIKLTPAARVTSDNSRDESERKRIVASCLGKLLAAIGESKCSRMVSWLLKKANMTLTSTSTTRLIERKSNRQRR